VDALFGEKSVTLTKKSTSIAVQQAPTSAARASARASGRPGGKAPLYLDGLLGVGL